MTSQLEHSNCLSKRQKNDWEFKCTLFPKLKNGTRLEPGVVQAMYLKDYESLFSSVSFVDPDEKLEDLLNSLPNQPGYERIAQQIKADIFTRDLLQEKRLKKLKKLNKKLFIVPLLLKNELNPIQRIRFLEYTFPLDSDIFIDLASTDRADKEYAVCLDIYDYKVAQSVTYDTNKKVYTTNMHEKVLNHGSNEFGYYTKWLCSLGNQQANYLHEVLNVVMSENKKLYKQRHEKTENLFDSDMMERHMIEELSAKTKKFILKMPYMSRTTLVEVDSTSENTGLIQEEYSMEYLKLLGYKECEKDYISKELLKFNIQKSIKTKDFLASIYSLFSDKKSKVEDSSQMNSDSNQDLIMRCKGKNAFNFSPMMWDEKWIELGKYYKKSYMVPFVSNYIN